MKAIYCTQLGDQPELTLEEVEPPPRGPGEVRISVRAAGLNFADLLMTRGAYQHATVRQLKTGQDRATCQI
jgi:NADPH2:quinone reductase